MAEHVIKMPDVGEGVAEAELVEWNVKVGDLVREDTVLAAVMTDKATVEIPSPVEGKVSWLGGEIGEIIAVGSVILKIEVAGDAGATKDVADAETVEPTPVEKIETPPEPAKAPAPAPKKPAPPGPYLGGGAPRPAGEKPLASPAVRLRAKEAGVDLRQVSGTGPAHRITHDDLDQFIARGTQPVAAGLRPDMTVEEIKIVGMRRKIAEKMALAKSRIPHITYIEEVNVTALEELRAKLNAEKRADRPKLTLLPFLMRAMVKAIAEQPQINALFDDDAGVIHRHGGVHIGIAAQTSAGLVVPVVRHAEARDLWACGVEVSRLAEAAKAGTATREELSGSTITITSLGAMGGVATTPVINYPEVAIIGVNKMMIRPVWDGTQFIPAKMMNLSSSFDHRVIDGWDAAVFIQRIKTLLETPALIFVD
ncbi:dihydrolipoamide acetyltransferase family protein [Aerobium aerolatum]|uniref:Dihydrolipoamide acetyltransferase component of pyruvate dehydrogenase complex n=1 Tax=Aquamicrobium aerolatum DSM 21857 TaxID=1121003 RepID=A0A1I3RZY8_9HYPH|nr:dihydrolipoamide acetyltransferase family protein [Aquamicrobium aerolatum]SFJ52045.1 2-oxoisovalerate dehydrogenase E2 component (dihydrolipoyl transacylase) [Aquamicrobium aerolatum DSM 21857]